MKPARRLYCVLSRPLRTLATLLLFPACSRLSQSSLQGDIHNWPKPQQEALERLARNSSEPVRVEKWGRAGTVARLELTLPPSRGTTKPHDAALAFLKD